MCAPLAAAAPLAAGAAGAAGTGMSIATMAQIAGAAMTGLSMLSNMSAQRSVAKRRNATNEAELHRQRQFQARADEVNRAQESNFTRDAQDESLGRTFQNRNAFIQESLPDLSLQSTREGAPEVVNTDLGKRIADALSYGRNMATSQAQLGAYGGNQFNNQVALNRSGQALGQIGDSSGRSSNIAGMELEGANQAGQGARNLADVFRLGGQGAMIYGMTRMPRPAPQPAANGLKVPSGAPATGLRPGGGLGLRY